MLNVIAEFLGTFFFLGAILATGQPIAIAVALLASIFVFGGVSGGHFNPAVSTMMLAKGDINMLTFLTYIVAQVLGGLAALFWFNSTKGKKFL